MPKSTKIEYAAMSSRARVGNTRDRKIIARENIGLVNRPAQHFASRGLAKTLDYSHQDCFQDGALGLVYAAGKHDPKKGALSTYADHSIGHTILRGLADGGTVIRIPASRWAKFFKATQLTNLCWKLRNKTNARSLVQQMRCHGLPFAYLANEPNLIREIRDECETPEESLERLAKYQDLYKYMLEVLMPRERLFLQLHFGMIGPPRAFIRISRLFKISRERTRQIIHRAIGKLQRAYGRFEHQNPVARTDEFSSEHEARFVGPYGYRSAWT